MKFAYEYRTSDNVRHAGVVAASDREAAFQKLREQGIRPGRLVEAPGLFNKLFGKGKRWMIIVALSALCLVLGAVAFRFLGEAEAERYATCERSQVFGDPSVIQKLSRNGWRETFPDEGEAWFARHAIPGKECDCPGNGAGRSEIAAALMSGRNVYLALGDADSDELRKMKRIVNGMKREFADYVDSPADATDYMDKACERCRIEKGVGENLTREIQVLEKRLERDREDRERILKTWDAKNATLRSLGLRTIPLPE